MVMDGFSPYGLQGRARSGDRDLVQDLADTGVTVNALLPVGRATRMIPVEEVPDRSKLVAARSDDGANRVADVPQVQRRHRAAVH
jgi:hypothetical protein